MSFFDTFLDRIGRWIAGRLEMPASGYQPFTPSDPETLRSFLRPGDVLLVEGNERISSIIKYLTQSTWSHAAIFVGDALPQTSLPEDGDAQAPAFKHVLIEANVGEGVVSAPLEKYQTYNTRICRPVGLSDEDRAAVVAFMVSRLGLKYDTRNIIDLARYLFPTPPVPIRWRRRLLALGSGEPTRAICSSLIAQAFQRLKYPILPSIERQDHGPDVRSAAARREIMTIRHHSLFTPRDFDLSPYFQVVKPTLERGFAYKDIIWNEDGVSEGPFKYRRLVEEPVAAEAGSPGLSDSVDDDAEVARSEPA